MLDGHVRGAGSALEGLRLLEPERAGVASSEEYQLALEQATDVIVIDHPEAFHFNVRDSKHPDGPTATM